LKPNQNWFQPIGFGSVILYQKLKPNRLVLVLFGLVRFGYFILKIKNYIFFLDFFGLSDGFQFLFGSVFQFSLIYFELNRFGLVEVFQLRFLGFRLMKQKPNQTKYFFKYSNRFNQFFFMVRFFQLFFLFSQFVNFFIHPYLSGTVFSLLSFKFCGRTRTQKENKEPMKDMIYMLVYKVGRPWKVQLSLLNG